MASFALRLPDHIMDQAKTASAEDDVSINQLLVAFISEGLGHRRGLKSIRARAARANIQMALDILDTCVPDVPPDTGDDLTEVPSGAPAQPRSQSGTRSRPRRSS